MLHAAIVLLLMGLVGIFVSLFVFVFAAAATAKLIFFVSISLVAASILLGLPIFNLLLKMGKDIDS